MCLERRIPNGVPWQWFSYAYPGPGGMPQPLSTTPRALPVPWNRQYLDAFATFLKVVAARYATNHEFETIGVSGPTSVSTEMSLPDKTKGDNSLPTGDDITEFAQKPPNGLGYTPAIYEAAWASMFARFNRFFAHQYMSLALHNVLPINAQGKVDATSAISTELTVLRAASAKYPESLLVQANGLGANSGATGGPYPYVEGSCSQVITGFQTHNAAKESDFTGAMINGVGAGAHYIETYQDGDLLDSSQLNLNTTNAAVIATTSQELLADMVNCDALSMKKTFTPPSSVTISATIAPALASEVTINIFSGKHLLNSSLCGRSSSGLNSLTTCTVHIPNVDSASYSADIGAPGVVPHTAAAFDSVSMAAGATSTPVKPVCKPGDPSNCS